MIVLAIIGFACWMLAAVLIVAMCVIATDADRRAEVIHSDFVAWEHEISAFRHPSMYDQDLDG